MGNSYQSNTLLGVTMADKESNNNEDEILIVEEPDEIVSGDLDSAEEDDKAKKSAKRRGSDGNSKRGNDSQKRINELWSKRKEAEEAAARESRRADGATAKNQEYEKITASA